MRGKGRRSYAGSIRRKERKKSAVELQAEGLTERRIGEVLGVSKSEVHRLLAEANAEAVPDAALVEARRNRIRTVVDGQLESWVPRSLKGDSAAALVVTRFLDRLAKLDGVDAPAKVDMTLATREIDDFIARAEKALPPDVFLQLARFAAGETDAPEAPPSGVGAVEDGEADRDE